MVQSEFDLVQYHLLWQREPTNIIFFEREEIVLCSELPQRKTKAVSIAEFFSPFSFFPLENCPIFGVEKSGWSPPSIARRNQWLSFPSILAVMFLHLLGYTRHSSCFDTSHLTWYNTAALIVLFRTHFVKREDMLPLLYCSEQALWDLGEASPLWYCSVQHKSVLLCKIASNCNSSNSWVLGCWHPQVQSLRMLIATSTDWIVKQFETTQKII